MYIGLPSGIEALNIGERSDKMMERQFTSTIQRLRDAGLRPTKQRVGLAHLLYTNGNRHVTADKLHMESQQSGMKVSLATVYNTLHQFCDAGLLREVIVEPGRSYFDTNVDSHHHFFNPKSGELTDIPDGQVEVSVLLAPPPGTSVEEVSVVVRVSNT